MIAIESYNPSITNGRKLVRYPGPAGVGSYIYSRNLDSVPGASKSGSYLRRELLEFHADQGDAPIPRFGVPRVM